MGMGTGERGWMAPWLLAGSCPQPWGSMARGDKTSWLSLAPSGLSGMTSWLFWEGWRCEGGILEHRSAPSGKGD